MVRAALVLVVASAACTPAQAPRARAIGKPLALGGVGGMIVASAAYRASDRMEDVLAGFSLISLVGIAVFAAGDLSAPRPVAEVESIPARNHRWATILTQRASGAARDGRCARVRRLERKVRHYDRDVHDFVFMRDPEIVRCLTGAE